MARVKGPLYSVSASGRFTADLLFRSDQRGTRVARVGHAQPVTAPPATAPQSAVRQHFSLALAAWRLLNQPEKDAWNDLARGTGRNVHGWNLFASQYVEPVGPEPGSCDFGDGLTIAAIIPTAACDMGDGLTITAFI